MSRRLRLASFVLAALLAAPASAAKQTVKLAFIGPLTGGNSAIGLGGRNSADLAVKLRNADGKAKYQYELVVLDDECKPDAGVQVATRAAADKTVVAGITHYCSTVAMATTGVYHRFGLPTVVWGAVLPDITYAHDFKEIHRVNGTMINQNETAAKFMLDQGYKTWVVIHDTTDYGKGHDKYFTQHVEKGGGKILARFGVGADQQDFSAPAQFQGTSGIVNDDFIRALGPLAEGVVAFREGADATKLPGGKFFLDRYAQQNYPQGPEAYGPFAYVAAELLMDTIEKVGPDRKKIVTALGTVKNRESIVGTITFDDHGQNIVPVITKYVVQDGKWVLWEDSEYATGKRKLKKGK